MNNMIIDTREPWQIKSKSKEMFDNVEFQALSTGDFYDPDIDLCVERKEISDFISSYKSAHLQKQLIAMKQHKYPVLIISGSYSKAFQNNKFTHINIESWLGMLSAIMLNNIHFIQVENDTQLLKTINIIRKRIKEGKITEFTGEVKFVEKTLSPMVKVLSLIDGISIKLAEKILVKYPMVNDIKKAIRDGTFSVKKIGDKKTTKIQNFLENI